MKRMKTLFVNLQKENHKYFIVYKKIMSIAIRVPGKEGMVKTPAFGYADDREKDKTEVYLFDQKGSVVVEAILFKRDVPGEKKYFKYKVREQKLTNVQTKRSEDVVHILKEYKVRDEEYEIRERDEESYFSLFDFVVGKYGPLDDEGMWINLFAGHWIEKIKIMVRDDILCGKGIYQNEEKRNKVIDILKKIGQEKFGVDEKSVMQALEKMMPKDGIYEF
jgi:hypothetical protein